MFSRKIRTVIAGIAILAMAACGSAASVTATHTHTNTTPTASKTVGTNQQAASGNAAANLARDNVVKPEYENYIQNLPTWPTIAQLIALGKFTDSLQNKESAALYNAESTLTGMIMAFYIATKNVPTMAQIQAQAQVVNNTL